MIGASRKSPGGAHAGAPCCERMGAFRWRRSSALRTGEKPRMIRILYVTDSLIAGGIESQLVELIRRLDRSRFEPHVLVFYKMPTHSPHFLPQLREAGVPVTTLDLGWGARDKLEATRQVIAQTWRLRPQIVQAENYHANLLTRAARPFMPPKTRLIGTHRGVYTRHQLRYERLEHRLCDTLVASAGHLRRQLIEGAGVPADRVVVIPNSVDVERFSGAAARGAELRATLAPGARRVIVSLGRVSREKRMELIAEALGLLKREGYPLEGVQALIVGHSQEVESQALLDAAIAREGLGDVIAQRPTTSEPEIYLAACDATILASPSEGLPVGALAGSRQTTARRIWRKRFARSSPCQTPISRRCAPPARMQQGAIPRRPSRGATWPSTTRFSASRQRSAGRRLRRQRANTSS